MFDISELIYMLQTFWRPPPEPLQLTWSGHPLISGIYSGVIRSRMKVESVLCRGLGGSGSSRVLLVNPDGLVHAWHSHLQTWLIAPELASLQCFCKLSGQWGAFDGVVIVVETTLVHRARRGLLGRQLCMMISNLPPRPWLIFGIGDAGYHDGLFKVIRYRSTLLNLNAPIGRLLRPAASIGSID